MKELVCIIIIVVASYILGAFCHEEEILREIKETGKCESSCFTFKGRLTFEVK